MGDMTPEKMAAMFADMENLKTKLSALEAAESDRQQKSSSEMSAHFSAEAAKVFAKPTCKNRLPIKCPKTGIPLRANVIGMFTPAAAQFSAADAATTVQKQLTALEEYVAQLPESIAFSEQVDDRGEPANGTSLTPYQREVLGSETMWKHIGPAVLNKILEPATK
jgi:hypothetical protein